MSNTVNTNTSDCADGSGSGQENSCVTNNIDSDFRVIFDGHGGIRRELKLSTGKKITLFLVLSWTRREAVNHFENKYTN